MNNRKLHTRWRGRALATLLLCSASLSACTSDPPTGSAARTDIYPLAIGNSWVYKRIYYDANGVISRADTVRMVIEADTMMSSRRWYRMTAYEPFDQISSSYLRLDSGFVERTGRALPKMIYKYPATRGESYMGSQMITVKKTDTMVATPSGAYSCYQYVIDGDYHEFLSPGIGLVKVAWDYDSGGTPGIVLDLIGCTIN